jgi:hypothetical protein
MTYRSDLAAAEARRDRARAEARRLARELTPEQQAQLEKLEALEAENIELQVWLAVEGRWSDMAILRSPWKRVLLIALSVVVLLLVAAAYTLVRVRVLGR